MPIKVKDADGIVKSVPTLDEINFATATGQSAGNSSTASIDGKTPNLGEAVKAGSVPVTVATDQVVPVSAAALPLPAGAATLAAQTSANTYLGNIAGNTASGATQATLVEVRDRLPAVAQVQPLTDTQLRALAVQVSASALPLPTGAATEATLAGLNAKNPALGQAAMAGSVPVAIASNQSAIPVSASSLPLPTGAASEASLAAILAKLILAPSTEATLAGVLSNLQLKANKTDTQPVSAASLPLPSGAASDASLAAILAKLIASPASEGTLASILSSIQLQASKADTQPVSGPLTDTQLRATSVPVTTQAGVATDAKIETLKPLISQYVGLLQTILTRLYDFADLTLQQPVIGPLTNDELNSSRLNSLPALEQITRCISIT